ncbi:MAG TPA: rhodanese-like domain-containing protein [Chitinophagaceae bacterium]|nr:rhodanese-like domain-containing protein [Chitinophagaceae bacterium]
MGIFSFLGLGNRKIKEALRNGAVVIDVRTAYEFDHGHVPQSINIPVDRVHANIARIKDMKKPVIFCCATGMRSGKAVQIVKANGLNNVYNGGSWESVLKMINKL